MTEPNNPLFEDEKEFLERKKLEYERALRGDVEEIKVQTIQVGKVALVGAGVVSGIWLLTKIFGGGKAKKKRKHKKAKHADFFDDYSGFEGFEDDNHDQELHDLTSTFHSPDYAYDHADRYAADSDGFYQAGGQAGENDYFSNDYAGDDDNGLGDYPDFAAHSSTQHGSDDTDTTYGSHAAAPEHLDVYHTDEDHGDDGDDKTEPAYSYASANSYQARPYDDSRRLPESNSFAEDEEEDEDDEHKEPKRPATAPESKKPWLVPAIVSFAKSETGKVVLAQAAALAMGFISSKVKDIVPGNAADANKNADLAASSAPVGASPKVWPATTAAQDASAAAKHDDLTYREPLA